MKGTILLNYDENTRRVEDEEKQRFLHSILEQMGVPLDFWISGEPLTVQQKMQLRQLFSSYGIHVADNRETMEIYVEGEVVASWSKPHYILKKDLSQLDAKKRLYLEMTCEFWSLFEQGSNEP